MITTSTVLIRKAYRYRIYPTQAQEERLVRWESALRFLWNIANEQRVLGYARPRDERRFPTAFDQMRELTDLRAELPWLADVPRDVCANLLVKLDMAWQRCFKRIARAPRWKRKGRYFLSLTESHSRMWRMDGTVLRFPKLGNVSAVVHRPTEGQPKTCTICREGDQWFVSLAHEVEVDEPVKRTDPVVAIDRGITSLIADSDGRLVPNPKHLETSLRRLARAQRNVARKKKGSKNREKAKVRVMRIHRKVRRQREHFLHVLSSGYAKSHGTVVVEKLSVQGMVKNRRLARHIAGAGWGVFVGMLRYKQAWSGGTLVDVPAQYSSQTCSACGVVDAKSRAGERFCCSSCGYVDHADLNAAKVLKTRANRSCQPVEGSLKLGTPGSRKQKVKLRCPRRSTYEGAAMLGRGRLPAPSEAKEPT